MKGAIGLAIVIIFIAVIVLVTADLRHSDASIEKPMIKVVDTFPTEKAL
mgnify:FL=1